MADKVYTCLIRSDIPNSTLQLLDLEPNESQRNQVLTTPGQTKYLQQVQNDVVRTKTVAGVISTVAPFSGVAAYLIDHVVAGGTAPGILTRSLTEGEANTAAAAIIAAMRAGTATTIGNVDAILVAVEANTGLLTGGSDGVLEDLLKILSGATYTVPAGHILDNAGGVHQAAGGAFDATKYRQLYKTSSFILSNAVGAISEFKKATFEYEGTAGAALLTYSDTGTVL